MHTQRDAAPCQEAHAEDGCERTVILGGQADVTQRVGGAEEALLVLREELHCEMHAAQLAACPYEEGAAI